MAPGWVVLTGRQEMEERGYPKESRVLPPKEGGRVARQAREAAIHLTKKEGGWEMFSKILLMFVLLALPGI